MRLSIVPAGNFAKAASLGANIVTASAFLRVSTKPRSETILTSVEKSLFPTAISTTSSVGS